MYGASRLTANKLTNIFASKVTQETPLKFHSVAKKEYGRLNEKCLYCNIKLFQAGLCVFDIKRMGRYRQQETSSMTTNLPVDVLFQQGMHLYDLDGHNHAWMQRDIKPSIQALVSLVQVNHDQQC